MAEIPLGEEIQPLPVEAYTANRMGGSLIIVDPTTNRTSGALLVRWGSRVTPLGSFSAARVPSGKYFRPQSQNR